MRTPLLALVKSRASVLMLTGALLTGCDSGDTSSAQRKVVPSRIERPPWINEPMPQRCIRRDAEGHGFDQTYSGRVVDARGVPLAGAVVKLFGVASEGDGVRPGSCPLGTLWDGASGGGSCFLVGRMVRVRGEFYTFQPEPQRLGPDEPPLAPTNPTTTDANGYFSATTRRFTANNLAFLAVSYRGEMRRGVEAIWLSGQPTLSGRPLDFGTIVLARTRRQPVTVRCLDHPDPRTDSVRLTVRWSPPLGESTVWVNRFLEDGSCPSPVPGFQPGRLRARHSHTDRETVTIDLPIGTNQLHFYGCGEAQRSIDVPPGEGDLEPLVVEMAAPPS